MESIDLGGAPELVGGRGAGEEHHRVPSIVPLASTSRHLSARPTMRPSTSWRQIWLARPWQEKTMIGVRSAGLPPETSRHLPPGPTMRPEWPRCGSCQAWPASSAQEDKTTAVPSASRLPAVEQAFAEALEPRGRRGRGRRAGDPAEKEKRRGEERVGGLGRGKFPRPNRWLSPQRTKMSIEHI